VTVFPGEIYQAARSWAERAYPKIIYFHEVDKAVTSRPGRSRSSFASELRAAFRSLR